MQVRVAADCLSKARDVPERCVRHVSHQRRRPETRASQPLPEHGRGLDSRASCLRWRFQLWDGSSCRHRISNPPPTMWPTILVGLGSNLPLVSGQQGSPVGVMNPGSGREK
jgi:hypothetical protein